MDWEEMAHELPNFTFHVKDKDRAKKWIKKHHESNEETEPREPLTCGIWPLNLDENETKKDQSVVHCTGTYRYT